jgi:hypothetical protein
MMAIIRNSGFSREKYGGAHASVKLPSDANAKVDR